MGYYSNGKGMPDMDSTFNALQSAYDNAEPSEDEYNATPKILRVVVYLTYNETNIEYPEEAIEYVQSSYTAELDIKRVLMGYDSLKFTPDEIQVVDADYFNSIDEAQITSIDRSEL